MENKEKDQLLFIQLILMFQTAAMQHMGKLKNPLTDKVERDLSQAQISIDMLEMLHKKTKSSLSQEEERMLSMVLQELRLNYVDEVAKAQSSPAQPSPGSSSTESTTQS